MRRACREKQSRYPHPEERRLHGAGEYHAALQKANSVIAHEPVRRAQRVVPALPALIDTEGANLRIRISQRRGFALGGLTTGEIQVIVTPKGIAPLGASQRDMSRVGGRVKTARFGCPQKLRKE